MPSTNTGRKPVTITHVVELPVPVSRLFSRFHLQTPSTAYERGRPLPATTRERQRDKTNLSSQNRKNITASNNSSGQDRSSTSRWSYSSDGGDHGHSRKASRLGNDTCNIDRCRNGRLSSLSGDKYSNDRHHGGSRSARHGRGAANLTTATATNRPSGPVRTGLSRQQQRTERQHLLSDKETQAKTALKSRVRDNRAKESEVRAAAAEKARATIERQTKVETTNRVRESKATAARDHKAKATREKKFNSIIEKRTREDKDKVDRESKTRAARKSKAKAVIDLMAKEKKAKADMINRAKADKGRKVEISSTTAPSSAVTKGKQAVRRMWATAAAALAPASSSSSTSPSSSNRSHRRVLDNSQNDNDDRQYHHDSRSRHHRDFDILRRAHKRPRPDSSNITPETRPRDRNAGQPVRENRTDHNEHDSRRQRRHHHHQSPPLPVPVRKWSLLPKVSAQQQPSRPSRPPRPPTPPPRPVDAQTILRTEQRLREALHRTEEEDRARRRHAFIWQERTAPHHRRRPSTSVQQPSREMRLLMETVDREIRERQGALRDEDNWI